MSSWKGLPNQRNKRAPTVFCYYFGSTLFSKFDKPSHTYVADQGLLDQACQLAHSCSKWKLLRRVSVKPLESSDLQGQDVSFFDFCHLQCRSIEMKDDIKTILTLCCDWMSEQTGIVFIPMYCTLTQEYIKKFL